MNPENRFEPLHVEEAPEGEPDRTVPTEYYRDEAESVLAENSSPDIPFTYSLNPYRGCEHGCIYCYARPTHEYYGLSSGLDFESKIFVKTNLADKLRAHLMDPSWEPQSVALSGNTDPYQPAEDRFRLTREALEVFYEFRNPVSIITKSARITRDVDLLSDLAELNLVSVTLSVTTLRDDLARTMEPRAARPQRRLDAVRTLSDAGVPVGVNAAPVIPGLTDEELPAILEAAADHGARIASYIMVRLPHSVKDLFDDWLRRELPDRKNKILNQIRSVREGQLNEVEFGRRMKGEGELAELIRQLFEQSARRFGLDGPGASLSTDRFRRPGGQTTMFD